MHAQHLVVRPSVEARKPLLLANTPRNCRIQSPEHLSRHAFRGTRLLMKATSTLTQCSVLAIFAVSLLAAGGCSSKNKTNKAATGTAKPTTKQPPSAPKPSKKGGANVIGSKAAATPVQSSPECTAEENGLAVCVDSFAVFCSDTKVYAIDCAEAFAGTCGEIDGAVDCVVEVEE